MYGNSFYNPQRFQPVEQMNQINPQINQLGQQMNQQFMQNMNQFNNQMTLLGKSVDSIEVVKAMDIPLDGSISYFPLTDGSAIVTKKLQSDGTSKTIIYKPIEESNKEVPNYVTFEELENAIADIDLSDIKDLKDEFEQLQKEMKEIKNGLKERKK